MAGHKMSQWLVSSKWGLYTSVSNTGQETEAWNLPFLSPTM